MLSFHTPLLRQLLKNVINRQQSTMTIVLSYSNTCIIRMVRLCVYLSMLCRYIQQWVCFNY